MSATPEQRGGAAMSEPTALVWRECVCGAWYWGSAQTDADKAHSHYEARADALDVEALRNMFKGISLPPGPDFAWVEAHRPFIEAALETIDRWEAEARADVLDVLRELTRAASEYADSTGGISGDLGARLFDARAILAERQP